MSTSPFRRGEVPGCDVLQLLSHPMRRALVRELEGSGATTVDSLAGVLGRPASGAAAVDDGHGDVALLLHHAHLPRLAAAGVLDYDRETGAVEPRDALGDVGALLHRLGDEGA